MAPPPSNPPQADPPAAPAAAEIVVNGERTEAELQLARELETERAARKKAEMDAAQLQDEVHRLTTPAKQEQPIRRGPFGVRTH